MKKGEYSGMFHVVIVDDDKDFAKYITRIIELVIDNNSECQVKISEFYSGENFIKGIEKCPDIDLLILDMEMGGIDGDKTAELFRMQYKDAILVFCSGVRTPTVKSFKVTPYRYLLKSYSDKQFLSEMKEIFEEIIRKSKEEYIVGHYRNNLIKVKIYDILYIENAKRGSVITVCSNSKASRFDGKILVDDKLDIISAKYEDLIFAHSSYLINVNHIDKITSNEVYLDNNECLTISRTYRNLFRELFTKRIAGKY